VNTPEINQMRRNVLIGGERRSTRPRREASADLLAFAKSVRSKSALKELFHEQA
jgi:hypothetical protein